MESSPHHRLQAILIGLVLAVCSMMLLVSADQSATANLPQADEPIDSGSYEVYDEISAEFRDETWKTLRENQRMLEERGISLGGARIVGFDLPLRAANGNDHFGTHIIANYVDHNPNGPNQRLDFNCGTRTYDSYNYDHKGTDFWSYPLPWQKVDNNQLEVIAAAPAIIINKHDGNYDRQCSITGARWNAVYVEHADGSVGWYGHLKSGSLTHKEVGDTLKRGEYIGVVGSSGNSTGPHLHFELYDADGRLIDPFAGTCNQTDNRSWWLHQEEYYEPAVLAVTVGSERTTYSCGQAENTHEQASFDANSDVYFTVYYRDALAGLSSIFTLRRPDGSIYKTWSYTPSAAHQAATYVAWKRTLDAASGEWTLTIEFNDKSVTKSFAVITRAEAEQPTEIALASASADSQLSTANSSQLAIMLLLLGGWSGKLLQQR